jgi:mannose-6-phosphate isomerase-like protein (cupin superfamily)
MMSSVIARRAADLQGFRISPTDSNYFACLFDPTDGVDFTLVIEIFAPGGATPPNSHSVASETFLVLAGEGVAVADGVEMPIGPGDAFTLRPGTEHVVRNTGAGKLYCLTLMVPNEGFAELIRNGEPVALGADDIAVLTGRA